MRNWKDGRIILGILLLVIPPIGLALIIYALVSPKFLWICSSCDIIIEQDTIKTSSTFSVISTSKSTKRITTTSPQIGVGRIGGSSGTIVGLGSSTSHVPTVLGRIMATHQCPECSSEHEWQFDTEVQVWTDATTGEISNDITGEIHLPV